MKKAFRVLSTVFAVLFLIEMLALAVFCLLPLFNVTLPIANPIIFVGDALKGIANSFGMDVLLFNAIVIGAPLLLTLLALIFLCGKGKGFGSFLLVLATLPFIAFVVYFRNDLFSEVWQLIASIALPALSFLFIFISMLCRKKKEQQPVEEVVTTEKQPDEQPQTNEQDLYVPQDSQTVQEVVNDTYGNEQNVLNANTLAKINKVRLLYENGTLTIDEYVCLVKKYLED